MKYNKEFEMPRAMVVLFDNEDVITASTTGTGSVVIDGGDFS